MLKDFFKKITPSFIYNAYHYCLAFMGAIKYRFPSRELVVIGVTGTSGKSTVVDLASRILQEAGYAVASASSIRFRIQNEEWENKLKMTMPGRFFLQKFLRQAVDAGCKYAVIEVTSEGIKQHRHRFINFATAVFTNLSPEHIESHGSFERYRRAKLELFKATPHMHIVNLDDKNASYFLQTPSQKKLLFSIKEQPPSNGSALPMVRSESYELVEAENVRDDIAGIHFLVGDVAFQLKLLGRFNVPNALAAVCIGLSQGVSLSVAKTALRKVKGMPGRMEVVVQKPFTVIVDYALTPVALQKVYQTLKGAEEESRALSKMICVLGACGGGRDKWKRSVLGKLAADYCREVIVTNEDPYDENPMEIINQVAKGANGKAKKIVDRREAIREALRLAQPNDVVVVTGKGCEPWMCMAKGEKIPWDDRLVVRQEFQKLLSVSATG